jgi:hypothetical protein
MGLYRVVREDGSVEYTDVPSGSGQIEAVRPGSTRADDEARRREDAKTAETLIREAQKRIPKVTDYLDYLEYLRHNSPIRFNRVMDELRREDPQTWLKLQKYPQFRPLRETALGLKAGSNLLGAGVGLATGKFTGSVERWMESTLKDLMKRDRFGPYADVLGSKASTLPGKATSYSNSRLGQYLKMEDPKAAVAAKAAAKELEMANSGSRAAAGGAVVRVMGPLVDLGIGALRVETFSGLSYIQGVRLAEDLKNKGILDTEEAYMLPRMMAAKEFDKVIEMIRAGTARAEGR